MFYDIFWQHCAINAAYRDYSIATQRCRCNGVFRDVRWRSTTRIDGGQGAKYTMSRWWKRSPAEEADLESHWLVHQQFAKRLRPHGHNLLASGAGKFERVTTRSWAHRASSFGRHFVDVITPSQREKGSRVDALKRTVHLGVVYVCFTYACNRLDAYPLSSHSSVVSIHETQR